MVAPLSTLSLFLGVVLGGLLLLWMLHSSSSWHRASKSGARLPKGSFGWPIIGETLAFSRNPPAYVSSHVKRYGRIFKSSLLLRPMIVGTTPEFAKFVLTNSNLFVSGWPASVAKIIGPKSFAHKDGLQHSAIKKILQKPFLPEALRTKVDLLETIILENLASWAKLGSIDAAEAVHKNGCPGPIYLSTHFLKDPECVVIGSPARAQITMDTGMYLLLGLRDIGSTPEGRSALQNLMTMSKALHSPPVNLTGTAFSKGLKAKEDLRAYLKCLLKMRKTQKNSQDDMLGVLSAAQDDPQARAEVKDLDDETVADNLVILWYGAYDTNRTTFTWILKFLMDNPAVFLRVQAEQQEIFKGKDLTVAEPRITWEDTKKMVYTTKFFQEIQRTLSISSLSVKKATQDVEFDGYLIPKGWGVALMVSFIHQDPTIYLDPKSFNPDRFDNTPKPYTYLPFSAGPHMCPGLEISKLLSFIFIHHLTTTYIFENTEPDKGIEYKRLPRPVGGYPINIRLRN